MTDAPIEQYVITAGLALYPLLYEDAPFPESKLKPQRFGPYAEAVEAIRAHHAQRIEQTAKTGTLYDVYEESRTIWEGMRVNDDGSRRLGLLDDELKKLAWGLEKDAATQIKQNGTKPKAKSATTEYIVQPDQSESIQLIDKLKALGFTFRLNLCGGIIEVNGKPFDEFIEAEIRVALRDVGLHKKISAAEDAYVAEAKRHSYHPVREYLDALEWDGADHITALTRCMRSGDASIAYSSGVKAPLHHVYIYRWLIGAVAKVYTGTQNPMMVWDGGQGIGKSTLVAWLCPLPSYFVEGAINVSDKDSLVRLASTWIWEVAELDATTRKADQSALKDFITKQVVVVRKAYGRADFRGPAMASMIGTLNNTSGFLADETGSRRFMITKLDHIDLKYQDIDRDQLWAQAVYLYRSGESWQLRGEEAQAQARNNEGYEVSTVLTDWLERAFEFGPDYDEPYSLADIISAMELDGFKISGSERSQAMELARVLTKKKARKVELRYGNRWIGLYRKPR